jgi:hypothetical protein
METGVLRVQARPARLFQFAEKLPISISPPAAQPPMPFKGLKVLL